MVRLTDLIREGKGGDAPDEKGRKGTPAEKPDAEAPTPVDSQPPDPVWLKRLKESEASPVQPTPPEIDWYGLAEVELSRITGAVRQERSFRLDEIAQIAAGMVYVLKVNDQLLAKAISHSKGPPLISNLVNVAILSTKIGMGLGYQTDQLVRLALAALVHDVGMFRLPASQLNDAGQWSAEQIDALRRHPILGAEVLKQMATDHPWLPGIVVQVHERADGTGYPHGLQGQQIHESAQIIGIADVLDTFLNPRPSRKPMLPHEAVRRLVAEAKTAFPIRVLKSLLQELSLYPVGTWVKLASGEMGEVIRLNKRLPLRPVVKITIDQKGRRLPESREVDLSRNPLLHVKEIADTTTITA